MKHHSLSAQIARDLFYVHENRVNTYKQLLHESGSRELDMKAIIERMVEAGIKFRQQLVKIGTPESGPAGEIYKSWQTMISPVAKIGKKTILATLADDELIIMNTYSLALSLVTESEMINLLESQQQELKKLHAHIRQYHHAQ